MSVDPNVQLTIQLYIQCLSISLTNWIISYSDPTLGEDAVATHSCNHNYVLIGDTTRTCQFDSRWTLSAPYCAGKVTCIKIMRMLHYYSIDQALVQLKFGPTDYCLHWSVSQFMCTNDRRQCKSWSIPFSHYRGTFKGQ